MPSAYHAHKPQSIFLALEGMRGILALTVCFGHFGLGTFLTNILPTFNLHFAVDLFFIISGFVMAYANYYVRPQLSFYTFLSKRFARLYPLHLLTLLLMVLLYHQQDKVIVAMDLVQNMLLVHNLGLPAAGTVFNFPSWSISVEFWCTLLFFGFTVACKNIKVLTLCLLFFILFFAQYHSVYIMDGSYENNLMGVLNAGLLRGLIGTALGILLYLATQKPQLVGLFQTKHLGWSCGLLLACFMCIDLPSYLALLFYGAAWLFIGQLIQTPQILPLLSQRAFITLGAWSYAIYLLHIPIYQYLAYFMGNGAVKGLSGKLLLLPCLFLCSWVIYRFFEKPTQQFLKRLLLSPQPTLIGATKHV